MTKWYRDINVLTVIGEAATGIVAFGLLIAGFLFPPPGAIDPSVVQAVGEVLGLATIWMVPKAISAGKTIKLEHGSTSITVNEEKE